ncbi:hypothetical protein ACQJBY_025278 [Aegilops geniculata]
MINKGLASLSSVVELLNEILNRSMVQPIDINVDKGMEKSYRIHDMVIDSICFCQVKKNHLHGTQSKARFED